MAGHRDANISVPPAQRSQIDAEQPGQRRLREAPFPPVGEQAVADGPAGSPGCVPENPNDPRQEPQRRFRSVEFPVRDAALVGAELVRDLALEQPQVEPAFA